jgi:hypothetical protein
VLSLPYPDTPETCVWRRVETVGAPCRPGPCTAQTNPRTETCRTVRSGRGGPLPATTGGAPCSHQAPATAHGRARRSCRSPCTAGPPAYVLATRLAFTICRPSLQCNYCKGRSNCSATVRGHVASPRRARPA